MELSVVICCQDEEETLPYTFHVIEQVLSSTCLKEVIVVDGGSRDGTLDLIRRWRDKLPIVLLEHPFDAAGWQRNRGMDLCTTDWVLGIDADMTFTKNLGELFSEGFFAESEVWDFPLYFTAKNEYHYCDRDIGSATRLYKSGLRFRQGHHPRLDVTREMKKVCDEVKLFENSLLGTQRALQQRGERWQPYQEEVRKVGPSHGKPDRYVEAEYWARRRNKPLPEEIAQLVIPRNTPALRAIDRLRNAEASTARGTPPPWVHKWRDGISIFSTCKPFRGMFADTQRNAIESWARLGLEIILVGDDEGTAEVSKEFGCIHVPEVERRQAPLMDSLFRVAQRYASYDIICYNNADIMLLKDFGRAVEKAAAKFPEQFLMIGQRWDTPIREPWDFSGRWEIRMMRFLKAVAPLHPPHGMDCLVWRRGLYEEIPPFGMGEPAYDSWLVWYAMERGVPVIDCTNVVTFVHQWHPRARDGVETRRNKQIVAGRVKHIGHAGWEFKKDGQIVKRKGGK